MGGYSTGTENFRTERLDEYLGDLCEFKSIPGENGVYRYSSPELGVNRGQRFLRARFIRRGGWERERRVLVGYSCLLNDGAKARIGVEKVVGGIPLDPKSVRGTLAVALLE
jgi:hypothetical protein